MSFTKFWGGHGHHLPPPSSARLPVLKSELLDENHSSQRLKVKIHSKGPTWVT